MEKIEEELLLEMAEIGRFDGYRIMVYGKEGPIPHFHIEYKEKEISCCVKILGAEYFQHGIHKDRLDKNAKKQLCEFLKSPHKIFGKHGYSNWNMICVYWNDSNTDYIIEEDLEKLKMPDYNRYL